MKRFDMDFLKKSITGVCINCADDIFFDSVSTDSRKILKNTLFVPLEGEIYDGHAFINDAVENGTSAFISSKKIEISIPYMLVENTLSAYHELASAYADRFNIYKIAITGSNGKTSTKDLLFSCFRQSSKTLKTKGNTNNLIGVPENIFRADDQTSYMILEMGMNRKGELKTLSSLVKPDTVIITNVNNSHIGNFLCFDDLISAKMEILSFLKKDGLLIVNGDDAHVLSAVPNEIRRKTFGIKQTNDYYPLKVDMRQSDSTVYMSDGEFKINVPGMGSVYSFLSVYAFCKEHPEIGTSVKTGLENFIPPSNRMNILTVNEITIIDDTYNASPSSVRNAIDVLSRFKGRKIAILADMLELGSETELLHEQIGKFAYEKEIDMLLACGEKAEAYTRYFRNEKAFFDSKEKLYDHLKNNIKKNDIILIKGSRMMKMEEVVNYLKESKFAL